VKYVRRISEGGKNHSVMSSHTSPLNNLEWHLNSGGLSNSLIDDLLANVQVSSLYKGIFSYNDALTHLTHVCDFVIIVNVGLHYVVMYGTPDYVLYIDSFGHPASQPNVQDFLSKCGRAVYHNNIQIQSMQSSFCGLYSAMFVMYFDFKLSGRINYACKLTFVSKCNDSELRVNDSKCIAYIKQMTNT